jgi:phosphomannomutase
MEPKFGTSGLRGGAQVLIGGEARRFVRAFCRFLREKATTGPAGSIALGHDLRVSSPDLLEICVDETTRCGFTPVVCGALPTPALALYAARLGLPAIMVTGSHIPEDRNGLKFYTAAGEIGKAEEAAITALARFSDGEAVSASGVGGDPQVHRDKALDAYRKRYEPLLAGEPLEGLRIGIHEHSSVAAGILGDVLARGGATIFRFGRIQLFRAIDTEAIPSDIHALYRETARSHRLDAIVSTDADGDRPLLADEFGRPLQGDLIGWTTACWLGADHVVTPVTSNSAIRGDRNFTVIRTCVGSPYVIAAIDDAITSGACRAVGFEANGGVLLGSRFNLDGRAIAALNTRDSLLPIVATLLYLRRHSLSASQLAACHGFRERATGRVAAFSAERSAALMSRLREEPDCRDAFVAPLGAIAAVDWRDGMRACLASGETVHLRPSGNAPEMRVYCEAETAIRAEWLLTAMLDRLRHGEAINAKT